MKRGRCDKQKKSGPEKERESENKAPGKEGGRECGK